MRHFIIGVLTLVLMTGLQATCADEEIEKPWERPGTEAGQEIEGPAGILLVWVPGGTFMMGSTDEDVQYVIDHFAAKREDIQDEQPAHAVELTGFWLAKTEVTVAQWRSVMGNLPERFALGGVIFQVNDQGEEHPVVGVTWNDCRRFCQRAGLELPTEAQWEYAAGGAESWRYPWGDEWSPERLCCDENQGPGGKTFPVGSFPGGASWCGTLDMAGNVWEWCADRYDETHYGDSARRNPAGPPSGSTMVLRGGSWANGPNPCRTAKRCHVTPDCPCYSFGGFRVAKNCPETIERDASQR